MRAGQPGPRVRAWCGSPRSHASLAYWDSLLLEHLDEDQARRLAEHAAFYGPDADFLKAQAARRRGDPGEARTLIAKCLKQLPGKTEFKDFAGEVGADVPDLS